MAQSSVFKSNKNQAVRLPESVALPDSVKRVDIVKIGHAGLIAPAGEGWNSWFDSVGVSDDFMNERDQSEDRMHGLSRVSGPRSEYWVE